MSTNSIIKLKGLNKELLVTSSEAKKINTIWEDKSISHDYVIHLGKTHFLKGDIKFIEENQDVDRKEMLDGVMKDFYEEEKTKRDALVKQTAEYKANLLDMFFYLYKISMDVEPTQEILDNAKKIQFEFFTRNPHRTLCDVHLLKTLIPKLNDVDNTKMWNHFKNHLKEGYFRLVEKAVFRDMQLSGQLKSNFVVKPLIEAKGNETIQEMKWRAEDNRKLDSDFNSFVNSVVKDF